MLSQLQEHHIDWESLGPAEVTQAAVGSEQEQASVSLTALGDATEIRV